MSVISGEAVEESRRLTDEEVLDIALSILKDIFPEEVKNRMSVMANNCILAIFTGTDSCLISFNNWI